MLAEVGEGLLDAFSIGFQPGPCTGVAPTVPGRSSRPRLHEVSIAPIGAYDGARVLAMRTPARRSRSTLPPMPEVNLTPLPPFVRSDEAANAGASVRQLRLRPPTRQSAARPHIVPIDTTTTGPQRARRAARSDNAASYRKVEKAVGRKWPSIATGRHTPCETANADDPSIRVRRSD